MSDNNKVVLMNIEEIPQGFEVTAIFGLVSSGPRDSMEKCCKNKFPDANAVIGIKAGNSKEVYEQGTAVRIKGPGFSKP